MNISRRTVIASSLAAAASLSQVKAAIGCVAMGIGLINLYVGQQRGLLRSRPDRSI